MVIILLVWEVEDIGRDVLSQQLIHLLFASAGGFANQEVCQLEVGTKP